MKFAQYFVILSVLFALPRLAFASQNPLVGTWILEKSENPMPDGSVVSYCSGVHGMITYTAQGFVSVALNCGPKVGNRPEPADKSGRRFFYSGTYQFDGVRVFHNVLNSSVPKLIGGTEVRTVTMRHNLLILTGDNQGQKFSAYWRKSQ